MPLALSKPNEDVRIQELCEEVLITAVQFPGIHYWKTEKELLKSDPRTSRRWRKDSSQEYDKLYYMPIKCHSEHVLPPLPWCISQPVSLVAISGVPKMTNFSRQKWKHAKLSEFHLQMESSSNLCVIHFGSCHHFLLVLSVIQLSWIFFYPCHSCLFLQMETFGHHANHICLFFLLSYEQDHAYSDTHWTLAALVFEETS